jgi:flagellar basal-body rod modification protein FlgD
METGVDILQSLQSTLPSSAAPAAAPGEDRTKLTQEEFFKILVAELSNQDPLAPQDSQKFLEQMASLQSLELTSALSDGIQELLAQQRLGSASALIGKQVIATDERGAPVATDANGQAAPLRVDRVVVAGDALQLVLEGEKKVAFENVREIRA